MKLQVRYLDDRPDEPRWSEYKLVLCDEDGNILPDQRSVTIAFRAGASTMVTVEFVVGGDVTLAFDRSANVAIENGF